MTDTSGMPTQFITNLAAFILFLLPKLQSTCMEMSALKVKKPCIFMGLEAENTNAFQKPEH